MAKRLRHGDYFGEADLLHTVGYTFFGDIIADSDDLECMHIPYEKFMKVPLYEQMEMRNFSITRKDIAMISFQYCKRYGIDQSLYANYYGA